MGCVYLSSGAEYQRRSPKPKKSGGRDISTVAVPKDEQTAVKLFNTVRYIEVPADAPIEKVPVALGTSSFLKNPLKTVQYFAYKMGGNPFSRQAGTIGIIPVMQQKAVGASAYILPTIKKLYDERLTELKISAFNVRQREVAIEDFNREIIKASSEVREGKPVDPKMKQVLDEIESAMKQVDKYVTPEGESIIRDPYHFPFLWDIAKILDLDRVDKKILDGLFFEALGAKVPHTIGAVRDRHILTNILTAGLRGYITKAGTAKRYQHIMLSLGRFKVSDIAGWVRKYAKIDAKLKEDIDDALSNFSYTKTSFGIDMTKSISFKDDNGVVSTHKFSDLYIPDLKSGVTQYILSKVGEKESVDRFQVDIGEKDPFILRNESDLEVYKQAISKDYDDYVANGGQLFDLNAVLEDIDAIWRISRNTILTSDHINPTVSVLLDNIARATRISKLGLAYIAATLDSSYIIGAHSGKRVVGMMAEFPTTFWRTLRHQEAETKTVDLLSKLTGTGLDSLINSTQAFAINQMSGMITKSSHIITKGIAKLEEKALHWMFLIPLTDTLARLHTSGYAKSYTDILLGFQYIRAKVKNLPAAEQEEALRTYVQELPKNYPLFSRQRLQKVMGIPTKSPGGKIKYAYDESTFIRELDEVSKHAIITKNKLGFHDIDLRIDEWDVGVRKLFEDRLIENFTYTVLKGDKSAQPLWTSKTVGNFLTAIMRFTLFAHIRRTMYDMNVRDKVAVRSFMASLPITWLITELYYATQAQKFGNEVDRQNYYDERRRFLFADMIGKHPSLGVFPSIYLLSATLFGFSDTEIMDYYYLGRPDSYGAGMVYIAPTIAAINSQLRLMQDMIDLGFHWNDRTSQEAEEVRRRAIITLNNGLPGIALNRVLESLD